MISKLERARYMGIVVEAFPLWLDGFSRARKMWVPINGTSQLMAHTLALDSFMPMSERHEDGKNKEMASFMLGW